MVRAGWIGVCLLCAAGCGCEGEVQVTGDRSTVGALVMVDGKVVARMAEVPARVSGERTETALGDAATDAGNAGGVPVVATTMLRGRQGWHEYAIVSCRGESLAIRLDLGSSGSIHASFETDDIEGGSGSKEGMRITPRREEAGR